MSDFLRTISDRLYRARLNEATSGEETLTYKEYLEISGAKDSKEAYVKFLTQTKGTDKTEADKQSQYHYDKAGKPVVIKEDYTDDDNHVNDVYDTPSQPKYNRYDMMEQLKEVAEDILSSSTSLPYKVTIGRERLNYTIGEYNCYSTISFQRGLSNLGYRGYIIYDPEVDYKPNQEDVPPQIDDLLEMLYQAFEPVVDSYNKEKNIEMMNWEDERNSVENSRRKY